ncbi:MAG TPA: chorismate lyase [Pseudomonadales bacterium]|nr:chorismate lyase [Pseudomonadales bacterium]
MPVIRWFSRSRRFAFPPPLALETWLFDPGSLTKRLQRKSHGRFRVQVHRQRWQKPRLDEAQALAIAPREWALVREVTLWGNDTPWVQARSVLPLKTLQGKTRYLAHLGSRPLGAALFKEPTLQRSPLQYAYQKPLWGRRSVFVVRGKPVLVAEYFLPALLHAANQSVES